jgi:uncharacterized protein YndB with AHSA1/START domain
MEKTIKKSINISAPKEKVWDILLNDKFNRIWYAEFSEGTHAETDWKVGSKVVFKDNRQSGMIGKIIENKPDEALSIEYQGILNAGSEDYESAGAKQMKGGRETYQLSEKEGITKVSIESGMTEEYFDSMSLAWDKALQKIKELSEAQEKTRSATVSA